MTGTTVVVSTIGPALRRRGIRVAELQRRLAERGIHVSRGALDRLASDQPLRSVKFDLLLPVLEELGITLGEPFVALPSDELERRQTAHALARETAQGLAHGQLPSAAAQVLVDEADQVDEAMIERLDRQLRRDHPEAFDARGRLRRRALTRVLAQRFGGLRLSGEQVDEVIARGRQTTRRRGAP